MPCLLPSFPEEAFLKSCVVRRNGVRKCALQRPKGGYANEASASIKKVHSTHSNTIVETAVTVTCQSKLKLCAMLHSFVQTNEPPPFTFLLYDPPLNKYFRNLFFTIKVHHHRYHYKHSNIGNQHCTYFTLWYNHIYCTLCHCWSYRVPYILKLGLGIHLEQVQCH